MNNKERGKKPGFDISPILVTTLSALGAILVYTLLVSVTSLPELYTGIAVAFVYAAAMLIYAIISKPKIDLEIKESELHPLLGEIMLSSMSKLQTPAFITDTSDGKIIWYNKEASVAFSEAGKLKGARPEDILTQSDKDESHAVSGENHYSVKRSEISAGDKKYRLYSLIDVTELDAAKKLVASRDLIVAYIMVDNLDEMLRNEQEEYRVAAAKTEAILRAWASDADGILKEYQADRYIFAFEAEKFDMFVEHRFDILDKIREIRVGTGSIPITVSIGVANVDGTFAEKEKVAQASLEMALQRGGDQVVVKNRDGSQSIYGGKTKTIQKKAKVRARVIANELILHISESSNVIIMAHKRPDFDAIGACLGLARLTMFCGVPVNIVTDFEFGGIAKCLDRIKSEPDYEGVLVSRDEAMDLVTPDTLLIIADVNNQRVFEEPHLAGSCDKIVIIDHHRKTEEFVKEPLIAYIEPSASAACELVCEMLELVLPDEMLLKSEADIMLAGILLDTNQFRKNTGTRTFSTALYLRDRGADISAVQEFFKTSLDDYERENKFRTNVTIYRGVTAISVGEGVGDSDDTIPASRSADKLLELDGIKASFVLIKIGDAIHVSARSVGTINVQLILEQLKGGGHFDSAGAQIKGVSADEVVTLLKAAIDRYLDDNNE
ncbi:MAG: DHH family phosphoesterase [Clostridia bacterium]|nr:DHH family phosphoesterase [Clostridia bacterium]